MVQTDDVLYAESEEEILEIFDRFFKVIVNGAGTDLCVYAVFTASFLCEHCCVLFVLTLLHRMLDYCNTQLMSTRRVNM